MFVFKFGFCNFTFFRMSDRKQLGSFATLCYNDAEFFIHCEDILHNKYYYFIMNLKNYIKIRNRLKFIMIIWFLLLAVPLIIVQLNGIPVDSLRIVGTEFFRQSYIVELVGMGTSLIFLVILLIVFRGRQAIDETTESKD